MSQPIRQMSFNAGELDPRVQGRSDLPFFQRGLKTCRNFVPLKSGPAMSRPGSTFVAEVKEVEQYATAPGSGAFLDAAPARPVRLQRFVFSDDDTCVLELGERYIRFHTLGRTLEQVPGTAYTLTTWVPATGAFAGQTVTLPIVAADLWKLRFAQVGNVITITGPNFMPIELRRNGPTDWSASETSFTPPMAVLPDVGDSYFTNPFNPGAVAQNIITTPFVVDLDSVGVVDGDHPEREWVHAFTAIMQHRVSGIVLESLATVVKYSHPDGEETWQAGEPLTAPALTLLTTQKFPIYPDMPLRLARLATAGALDPDYKTLGFRIYRGAGDLLGWIGDTRSREFIDLGAEPDYATQPPLGFNPFRRRLPATFLEQPLSVAFFQGRRVFGGGSFTAATAFNAQGKELGRLGTVFFSATGDYYNFDERLALHVEGEALTFEMASDTQERIRHMLTAERLVVLTNASAWTFCGQQGSPLDFNSVNIRRTDAVGTGDVGPLLIDSCVLFVRNKGTGARVLVPQSSDETPYLGADLSENAQHLVRGRKKIVDWAHQEDPFGWVWAVRSDGGLLSLTFDRARSVVGWARHDSEGGNARYESVCTVPEGEEDAVYVVVNREVAKFAEDGSIEGTERKRFIERFTSRERYDEDSDGPPLSLAVPSPSDTSTLYPTDLCLDCAFTYRGAPTRTFTGLERHTGKRVWVLARGMAPAYGDVDEEGELTIGDDQWAMRAGTAPPANAVDDADAPIFVAHVGLLFECDLESLAAAADLLRTKTVSEVGFELDSSKGIKCGQSFAKLHPWKQRRVSDSFGVISAASEFLFTPVANAYDKFARVCLRQSLPLPVTVAGIARMVE